MKKQNKKSKKTKKSNKTTQKVAKKVAKKTTTVKVKSSLNKVDYDGVVFTRPEQTDRCLVVAEKGQKTIHIKPEFRMHNDGKWWDDLEPNGILLKDHTEAKKLIKALQEIVGC